MVDGKILAIDFGLSQTGFAISDESQIIAKPLPILSTAEKNFLKNVESLLKQYQPKLIILGFPVDSNTKSSIINELKLFEEKLKETSSCEIIHVDESFSTQVATNLYSQKKNKKIRSKKDRLKMKEKLDSMAAQVILVNYIQNVNSNFY